MSASRRTFLQQGMMATGLIGLLESGASGPAFAERLLQAAAQGNLSGTGPAIGAHNSQTFWDAFGAVADAPDQPHTRGLSRKPAAAASGAADLSRQIDFFHYYTDPKTKATSLRFATSIEPAELLDHDGDVTASVNVNGFRMAGDDRATFDKLQSAQLRVDVLQNKPIMQYLDPMAWMSMAALFPDKAGKLPPLQNLSFDPATTYQKMQQIVLPGGSAQMAVNLSMAHKDSTFLTVLKNLTTEVDKFSPVLGLPAISITALKGFCSLYGAMEQRTTFLLNSLPLRAFATQAAREEAQTQQGVNLVAGDYVLVPHVYTEQLTPYLDKLDMRQGYLVPKGSPTNSSIYDLATALKPDITYLSATIGVKPMGAAGAPVSVPGSAPAGSSSPSKSGSGKGGSGGSGGKGGSASSGTTGSASGTTSSSTTTSQPVSGTSSGAGSTASAGTVLGSGAGSGSSSGPGKGTSTQPAAQPPQPPALNTQPGA